MNAYMDMQAKNMIQMVESFKAGMKFAAMKDDGKVDREEQKRLDRINRAADQFIKELQK